MDLRHFTTRVILAFYSQWNLHNCIQLSLLRISLHNNPSSDANRSVSSRWTAWSFVNGHPGSITEEDIRERHVIVLTDCYTKLESAIPVATVTSTSPMTVFVDNWVIFYGIPLYLPTENGLQFVSKFFAACNVQFGIKHLKTTAYHPQTKTQVECFNRTIVANLGHYVSKDQTDWYQYVQPVPFAYNAQLCRSTGTTTFSLVLSGQLLGPTMSSPAGTIPEGMTLLVRPHSSRIRFLH